jgi:hypothetical protein
VYSFWSGADRHFDFDLRSGRAVAVMPTSVAADAPTVMAFGEGL